MNKSTGLTLLFCKKDDCAKFSYPEVYLMGCFIVFACVFCQKLQTLFVKSRQTYKRLNIAIQPTTRIQYGFDDKEGDIDFMI